MAAGGLVGAGIGGFFGGLIGGYGSAAVISAAEGAVSRQIDRIRRQNYRSGDLDVMYLVGNRQGRAPRPVITELESTKNQLDKLHRDYPGFITKSSATFFKRKFSVVQHLDDMTRSITTFIARETVRPLLFNTF